MTATVAPSNHPVFLLAEHLDVILASLEDLQACRPAPSKPNPQQPYAGSRVSWSDFVRDLRELEATSVMRIGRARALTRELVRKDRRFAMLGGLFVGGTAALETALQRASDTTGDAFSTGMDPMEYLRSRGVIDEDAGGVEPGTDVVIDDTFQLIGEIELGPLMDLVDTFVNTIELHFDLFPELAEPNDVMSGNTELMI